MPRTPGGMNKAIAARYNNAMKVIVKKAQKLIKAVEDIDSGKKHPPPGVDPDQWRTGYLDAIARETDLARTMAETLGNAGKDVTGDIKEFLQNTYQSNYNGAIDTLQAGADTAGLNVTLRHIEPRQLDVIVDKATDRPFSRIAFDNIQETTRKQKLIRDAFHESALAGEDRKKLLKRITGIVDGDAMRAKRIAQTEHTRIQSEARYDAGMEATAQGVGVYNEWSTKMVNSRETHIALNGECRMEGEYFDLIDGDQLRFPGDPRGQACNTINCFCVLIPHVLLPGQRLEGNRVVNQ